MKTMKLSITQFSLGRVLIVLAFVTLATLAYFCYAPYVYAYRWQEIGQAWAMVIRTGAPLLYLTVFTLVWPKPGGIIVILYGAWQVWLAFGPGPGLTVPPPVIALLYLVFSAGGALSVIGSGPRHRLFIQAKPVYNLLMTARAFAFITIVTAFLVYVFIHPAALPVAIPFFIAAWMAKHWPAAGGVLMITLAALGLSALPNVNWDFSKSLPAYIFGGVYIMSGLIHLYVAWRCRNEVREADGGD